MDAIDVRDLVEQPGSSRRLDLAPEIEGLSTELTRVPDDRPVQLELLLESIVEGILVSGPVRGTFAHRCARCLREFSRGFDVEVTELFAEGATDEDDEYPLSDGAIDLEPMVRDVVLLSMPFSPLCRPDCQGLCERCGGNRNLGECTCPPRTDPRWSTLDILKLE